MSLDEQRRRPVLGVKTLIRSRIKPPPAARVPVVGSSIEAAAAALVPYRPGFQPRAALLRNPQPLRIGIIVSSRKLPAWIDALLQEIQATDFLELAIVVVSPEERSCSPWSTVLFRWYTALDYRLFRVKRDAFASVDMSWSPRAIPIIELAVPLRVSSCPFVDENNLDVIINLGSPGITDGLQEFARHGIWSLHHGGRSRDAGCPALFWEIYERNPVSATRLEISTAGREERQVLYQSFAKTDFVSLYRNRNAAYWKTGQFVMRRLRDLHRDRGDRSAATSGDSEERAPGAPDSRIRAHDDEALTPFQRVPGRAPGNREMARFLGQQLRLMIGNQIRTLLVRDQWFVAIRRRECREQERRDPLAERTPGGAPDMTGFSLHIPPGDRFYADPFLFRRGAATYLFVEEYPYGSAKGVISCMELDRAGRCSKPQVVLARDYHLSYPFVFEWQGGIYMIPETRDNRTIELYRAVQFPHQWTLEKVLMHDVSAVDATLFQHHGNFWLFVNMAVQGSSVNDELCLFSAASPLGPWEPHPQNPIVSDVRRARPAGRLFVRDGQLIRPSQDCSVRYGAAIWFNRVDVLSETEYRETPIDRIGPDWLPGNLACHTYNGDEEWEVVDGQLPRMRQWWWMDVRSKIIRSVSFSQRGCRSGSRAVTSARMVAADTGDASAAGPGGQ